MFIDGPIAGDVRTDFPPNHVIRVPVPARVTVCDCDPEEAPEEFPLAFEVVDYRAICHGPRVAIMSCEPDADDETLGRMLQNWMVSDLGNPLWVRHCRDRRAFT